MRLNRIHQVGQRYFPIPAYLMLFFLTVFSLNRLFSTASLPWLGATECSLPFFLVMLRIQVKKDLLRTNRGWLIAAAISGCVWSLALVLVSPAGDFLALLVSLLATTILLIDTYGYNYLQRPARAPGLALGERFPEMTLKDYQGNMRSLQELLKKPSLILFIRGSWCPLCMAQVKEVAGYYKELDARGVGIIVVSPQKMESSPELAKIHGVPMVYLMDEELKLASSLSLVHRNGVPIGLSKGKYGEDTLFPMVEISVAFSILIAFIVIGVFLFRIRERFDTIDVGALDRSRGGQG